MEIKDHDQCTYQDLNILSHTKVSMTKVLLVTRNECFYNIDNQRSGWHLNGFIALYCFHLIPNCLICQSLNACYSATAEHFR